MSSLTPVTVLYFAQVRDRLGIDREQFDVPSEIDVPGFLTLIASRHPERTEIIARCRIAVDHDFASGSMRLTSFSEIALIPPVSGG